MTVEFEIPRIQPKERPQVAYSTRSLYTPIRTRKFEAEVRFIYGLVSGHQFEGAVKVTIEFYFHRPKTVKREQPTVKPDLDNCIKSILDGLNPHRETYGITKGAWADDGQVVEIHAVKRYTGGEEKAIVRIEDYEHDGISDN